ncbi:MAG: NTPase, partial [Solobacterium sp.]|nr:NTPase [Solobacterium sp.]
MNYSTDRPIEKEEQDLLGRATFSKQLGKTIYEYDFQSGLVIGVFGKWGSGKTSVINMA